MAFDISNADINDVGLIALALYANASPTYGEIEASSWQTTQVSILSKIGLMQTRPTSRDVTDCDTGLASARISGRNENN